MKWLFLRGLAREQRHFGSFPALFERHTGQQVITMDFAGFGTESGRDSPATIEAIVDDLRARFLAARPAGGPWSLFALSLGGMIALNWAARHAGDFQRVVVGNTSAGDLSRPWQRFSARLWPRLPIVVGSEPITRERMILDFTSNNPAVDKEALARQWAAWFEERRPRRTNFLRQLLAASRSRLAPRIDADVLLLASRGDRLCSFHCSERIAARLGARLELHDAAGHDLSLDAPDWICERIAA